MAGDQVAPGRSHAPHCFRRLFLVLPSVTLSMKTWAQRYTLAGPGLERNNKDGLIYSSLPHLENTGRDADAQQALQQHQALSLLVVKLCVLIF